MNRLTIKLPSVAALGLYLCQQLVMPGALHAQYYDNPGLGQRPVAAHPQDYKPLGIRAGSFMLHPGVTLAGEYTDNVFYSSGETESDTIFHVRPYISAQSTWSRHSLNLTLAADIARHADRGERDYEDYMFGASGRVDVRSRSFFSYALDYVDLHEGLNNRASEQGVQPTRYNAIGYSVGYDHTINRLSLGARYSWQQLDFDDVKRSDGGVIDNQDRDRDGGRVAFNASYQFQTDKAAFITYSPYKVKYDQDEDRYGYDRSGDGYSLSGGLAFSITGKLSGDVSLGYHDRSYDDPRLPNVDGWGADAGLHWLATELTSVYGHIATSVEETTDANSSGSLQTVYSLRVDHELTRELQLNGFIAYRENKFQTIDTSEEISLDKDKIFRFGVGASWFINRYLYLNASYGFETLSSSLPRDDYDVNTFWLMLALEK